MAKQGLGWHSIITAGKPISLLEVANLSLGGDTIDITRRVDESVARLAAAVAQHLCLRFCGVDIVMADATLPLGDYSILEVNSAPGLDNYACSGRRQQLLVDSLYLKVLKAVERGPK